MALKGTIKDFGIADIFQLIGQQAKTGILILKSEQDQVRVFFREGSVIRAESARRPTHLLLGEMLMHAEVVTRVQLDAALKEQSRSLRRIGSILADMGLVSEPEVTAILQLQMTETVARLFQWDSGTYEFQQADVEASDEGITPVRAETILMEGLRMMDEWPALRKKIPSLSVTLERLGKALPPASDSAADELAELDFAEHESTGSGARRPKKQREPEVGVGEHRLFELIDGERTLEKLIHLSRLGEFGTVRAAANLLDGGYVRMKSAAVAAAASGDADDDEPAAPRFRFNPVLVKRGATMVARSAAIYVALLVLAVFLVRSFDGAAYGVPLDGRMRFEPTVIEARLAHSQIRVIRRALEVYRLSRGQYPDKLDALVEAGLLEIRDLSYPFSSTYFYKRDGDVAVVLPPTR